jgi:hypothetical protein
LYIKGVPKDKIIILGTGFPALKQFTVSCCWISCLTFDAGAMPKFERLKLRFNAQGASTIIISLCVMSRLLL